MLVKCRHCNNDFDIKQLARHLKAKHQTTYKYYLDMYWKDIPGYQLCEICNKMTYIINKKTCSMECYKILQSNKSRGRILPPRTKKHCEKISKKAKERLSNPENHPMYSKHQSIDSRAKTSKSHIEKIKKEGHWRIGVKNTLESRQKMRKSAFKRARQPDYINPMQGKTHTEESIKKIFSHRKMNKTEKIVADILTENGIDYYFQYFLSRDGVCKSYDFKIKGKPILIEIDGDYWHGGPGHKYDYFKGVNEVKENDIFKDELAKENGFGLVRVWESEIKKTPQLVLDRINE